MNILFKAICKFCTYNILFNSFGHLVTESLTAAGFTIVGLMLDLILFYLLLNAVINCTVDG